VWLYLTQYITDDRVGAIVGMEIIEHRTTQFGPEGYGAGIGAWTSREPIASDLDLVNWLLGWLPTDAKSTLQRIVIKRVR
jgi:hypothetical protein